eukprot:CAMPEP_0202843598 /NCGR_PEP_ID=MMETSP1389-20130828/64800_1 /ASSEMBLY_ACC=CAM_ASM_000865 /TAXON_ID=302021 /ORGANISM="Rhodomonas sp., Strain CCMP768" /LENGTH=48 /DNA_ID= /DNA_START= /DNA_END= /DNA_ORIENTATION=
MAEAPESSSAWEGRSRPSNGALISGPECLRIGEIGPSSSSVFTRPRRA